MTQRAGTDPRPDGLCGVVRVIPSADVVDANQIQNYDGATCDPNGPFGGCCSQYG